MGRANTAPGVFVSFANLFAAGSAPTVVNHLDLIGVIGGCSIDVGVVDVDGGAHHHTTTARGCHGRVSISG
jgi:hypothetical protein